MADARGTNRIGPDTVVLITGASSGIGQATAVALAALGCKLVLTARRLDRLEAVATALGPDVLAWRLDVRDNAAVDALPACLPERFRAIDVLVNNAGHDVGGRRPFAEGAANDWDDIIDTNLRAVLRVTSRDTGGQGYANADVVFSLSGGGGTIHTAAQISGKAASMGEGVVQTVLDALIKDFTTKLERI